VTELSRQTCVACEIGAPLVPHDQQLELLKNLDGWMIDHSNISKLSKVFELNNYEQSIKFTNLIAELAESEDHHPKITLEWGKVNIEWWSHKIKGLHMNDFICAAKSDEIYKRLSPCRSPIRNKGFKKYLFKNSSSICCNGYGDRSCNGNSLG
jgi:4a-hydroxytetrahydrobiopterin dehydratase